ncbi:MAG: GldG family protein [Halobacteriovoraceae bacterium]|nr:GldG family protein [Halobacteriovoraceae bacterium]
MKSIFKKFQINNRNENYLRVVLGLLSMTFLIHIGVTLFKRVQLDFTDENLYTLSEGSLNILKKIDAPVKLTLYYSRTAANKGTEGLRTFNNHFYYVRELLREYESNSRNNIILNVIDPRPDTEDEENAMAYGLKRFQISQSESYFFGLVAENESGTEKIIGFFDPGQKDKLEYEITKLIHTVLKPQKKSVGVLSSLDILNEDISPYLARIMQMQGKEIKDSWISIKMLKEFYNLKKIDQDKISLAGIDTLIIVHPKGFTEKTLMEVDQFLLKGGKILLLIDPNAISDRQANPMQGISQSPDAGFKTLMNNWGFQLLDNTYAGDKYLSGMGQLGPGQPPSRMIAILNCNDKCTATHKDPISSGIDRSVFIFPGVLKEKPTENIKTIPIVTTTSKGNSYVAGPHEINNQRALWEKFTEGKSPVNIGFKVVGKFKSAYPDKKGHLKESQKESAIVVFSDVDFIHNRFAFRETFLGPSLSNGNSTLFINAVESLSGDVDLMSVRSKSRINRSFDVIDEIEFEAEKKTAAKVKQINGNIARFQQELAQLGRKANEGNIALLQSEGLSRKKQLAKRIAKLKKELRNVKKEGREKIENIGKFFQYLNTLLIPFLIMAGGYYHLKRKKLMVNKLEKNKSPAGEAQ